MAIDLNAIDSLIEQSKKDVIEQIGDPAKALRDIEQELEPEIKEISALHATGKSAVPEIDYTRIAQGDISQADCDLIHKRGCVVVRAVFHGQQAQEWNTRIGEYLETNNFFDKTRAREGLDNYFSTLASSKPQIFGLYWSQPQMQARQSEELARVRTFLNGLWQQPTGQEEFDSSSECTYADRLRRRQPGDTTLGLSPHIDGGSVERWIDPGYRKVYKHIFSNTPQTFQPFHAAWRTSTQEIPSPAVCSMFRTFQGWTALTKQGPGDGTLNLVPASKSIAWVLLRALQKDIPTDELCGAQAGRALTISAKYHSWLLPAYVPIPCVYPGDTVWWHPDVIHGVEDKHSGTGYSNVIYIGSAPRCEKNLVYMAKQKPRFEAGKSAPDFAPEDYEVDFKNRFLPSELSKLGREQMGYTT